MDTNVGVCRYSLNQQTLINTLALSLIGSTVTVRAQIYQSATPNNVFSPISGTLLNLASFYSQRPGNFAYYIYYNILLSSDSADPWTDPGGDSVRAVSTGADRVHGTPYVLAQTLDPALPTCLRLSPPALTGSHLLIKRHEQVAEGART